MTYIIYIYIYVVFVFARLYIRNQLLRLIRVLLISIILKYSWKLSSWLWVSWSLSLFVCVFLARRLVSLSLSLSLSSCWFLLASSFVFVRRSLFRGFPPGRPCLLCLCLSSSSVVAAAVCLAWAWLSFRRRCLCLRASCRLSCPAVRLSVVS